MTLFTTSLCKNRLENDVIITNMISAGIHSLAELLLLDLLNHFILEKPTGPILPLFALTFFSYQLIEQM